MPAKLTNKYIRANAFELIREGLSQPASKSSKTTYLEKYVDKLMKEALAHPESDIGKLLAKEIIVPDLMEKLDEETDKLMSRDRDFLEYRILKQCFEAQRNVLLDNKIKRKVLMTSRRAGKTNLIARYMVSLCAQPNTPCLYIHTKFSNAIDQCYKLVLDVAKEVEMKAIRSSSSEGIIEFANGSKIDFRGNSNKAEADKMRGGKYRGIFIDEAAFQCNMKYLVDDVCSPMLMDYVDSVLVLASTPPRIPGTLFEAAVHGKEYKLYSWDMTMNPYIQNAEEEIKRIADSKGISIDDAFIKREYRGLEFFDTEAQVFKGYQTYDKIPDDFKPDHVYIGNDYGWAAYNAIIGVAIDMKKHEGYVFFEEKFNHADVTAIVESNKRAIEAGKKLLLRSGTVGNIDIYGDTSDMSILYEMYQKHGLPAHQCYKYDKDEAIAKLAEDLRKWLKVPENGICADEFEKTLYKRDEATDAILPEIDDDQFHPDAAMALLYASRQWTFDEGNI